MPTARLKVALDTSCLVSLFREGHALHEATQAECERLRRLSVQFVVPVHALLECYAVLTRMPPPHRIATEEAERLLLDNFSRDADIPGAPPAVVWSSIRELASKGLGGGKIYDAVIARSSFEAGASVLLTWNTSDFLRVAPPGLTVATPTDYAQQAPRLH